MTSLDIGRTESSEPSPYGSVPEGFMLLYFAAVMAVVLVSGWVRLDESQGPG